MSKKRFEKICSICKQEYKYCSQCSDFDHLPRWMDAYCSQNCKDLYNITAGWLNGWKDKDIEIERLDKIDLSKFDNYPQWLKDVIKDMQLYKENKADKTEVNHISSVDDANVVEPVKTDIDMVGAEKKVEVKNEGHKTEKKNYNYKKNYKK